MRLITRFHRVRTSAPWPATLGLATILVLSTTAWWRLRAEPGAAGGGAAPSPAPGTAAPLRLMVSADGLIALKDEGKDTPIALGAVAGRLSGLSPARPVELTVDPRTSGAAVDGLLVRLRDAGVSRCTLIVDRATATANTPAPPGPASGGERKEAGP